MKGGGGREVVEPWIDAAGVEVVIALKLIIYLQSPDILVSKKQPFVQ